MKKSTAIFTLLAVLSVFAQAQKNDRRDGNWWKQQDELEKLTYVTGLFDGIHLGGKFSYWDTLKHEKTSTCSNQALLSLHHYEEQYMSSVTNDQVVDGLNTFYQDYRNRSIYVFDALWIVLNSIAGKPQADIDRMTENFRKNAASNIH